MAHLFVPYLHVPHLPVPCLHVPCPSPGHASHTCVTAAGHAVTLRDAGIAGRRRPRGAGAAADRIRGRASGSGRRR
eukprot:44121-Chlamydomonas_euryale.AAC.1